MRHSATAATPRGTTPSDGLLTRIVAKPYARRSCETNYQRLPANGVCHEKSSSWPKPSCFWPLNVIQSSESADLGVSGDFLANAIGQIVTPAVPPQFIAKLLERA